MALSSAEASYGKFLGWESARGTMGSGRIIPRAARCRFSPLRSKQHERGLCGGESHHGNRSLQLHCEIRGQIGDLHVSKLMLNKWLEWIGGDTLRIPFRHRIATKPSLMITACSHSHFLNFFP